RHVFRARLKGAADVERAVDVPASAGETEIVLAVDAPVAAAAAAAGDAPAGAASPEAPVHADAHPEARADGMSKLALAGWGLGATGAAGLIVGTVFAIQGASRWKLAQDTCSNPTAGRCNNPSALAAAEDAGHDADVATGVIVASGAILALGMGL